MGGKNRSVGYAVLVGVQAMTEVYIAAARRGYWREEMSEQSQLEAALERVKELGEALLTADAWLDRWAVHVGNCKRGNRCTCGLTRVRSEAYVALSGKRT